MASSNEMRLYDNNGERLYLNPREREAFIIAAHKLAPLERVFCLMLAYTGCRISEARNLRKCDLQLSENKIAFRTLKRRKGQPVREVPIPKTFAVMLEIIFLGELAPKGEYLWSETGCPPVRITCYRWVKVVMLEIGLSGPKACPKGLRHAFGIHAVLRKVQLHMLSKWMGHASIETTAIYATVLGPEERLVARRMWEGD
jgi:integrase